MTEDQLDKALIEHAKPWAMVLHDCVKVINHKECATIPMGEVLRACCKNRGVEYPPVHIEAVILQIMLKVSLGISTPNISVMKTEEAK